MPRDREILVESVRTDVRGKDQETPAAGIARGAAVALAPGRGCAAKAATVEWRPSCAEDEGRSLEADRQG